MRYFLDTEFNGMGGVLLSLALVGEDGRELYLAIDNNRIVMWDRWVQAHVLPIVECEGAIPVRRQVFGHDIAAFLARDASPLVTADWPDDIAYFCKALITGPGTMADIRSIGFQLDRVDAYPTTLSGAVQHNALWDARALRHKIMEG